MGPSDEISGHYNGGKRDCVLQTGELYPLVQDHPDFADDGGSYWFSTPFGPGTHLFGMTCIDGGRAIEEAWTTVTSATLYVRARTYASTASAPEESASFKVYETHPIDDELTSETADIYWPMYTGDGCGDTGYETKTIPLTITGTTDADVWIITMLAVNSQTPGLFNPGTLQITAIRMCLTGE